MPDPPAFEGCPVPPVAGFIPMARPVMPLPGEQIPFLPYASRAQIVPMPMTPLRALLEMLALIPAGTLGGLAVYCIFLLWPVRDQRWFEVAATGGMGGMILLTIAFIMRIDGHQARTIGWTRRRWSANVGIGFGAYILFAISVAIGGILLKLLVHIDVDDSTAKEAIKDAFPPMTMAPMMAMMVFVSVWEEIAFRGFVLTRLHALFKHWWVSVLVGAMVFGSIHIYEGPLAVLVICAMGLIMGTLFVWRKSLVPGIVFHLTNNVVTMLALRADSALWQ